MTRTTTRAFAVFLLLGSACGSSTDVPKSTPAAKSAPGTSSTPAVESIPAAKGDSDYVFVWLKTGPHSAEHTKEEKNKIFTGHMANMQRLAGEKKLIIAGPFSTGAHDSEDRGIFVFDVATVDEARGLVETDPGVQSGEFRVELYPMRSSATLRKLLDLQDERKARAKREGRELGMEDMRLYELVTLKDMHSAEAVLPALEEQGKVIFSGRFGGSIEGWGVMVLDATSAHAVPTLIGPAMQSLGECWIDPWLSTKSLEGLRALRRG